MRIAKKKLTLADAKKERFREGGPSRQILFDSQDVGLGLRVYPSGRKAWILQYSPGRRQPQRLMTLGRLPEMTLAQARDAVQEVKAGLRQGNDPLEERKASSVSELLDDYLKYRAQGKKSYSDIHRRIEKKIRPALRRLAIEDTRMGDRIERLYRKIGEKTPYEANRVLALLHSIFNYAKTRSLFPADRPNPAYIHASDRFEEKQRKDVRRVSEEEVRRLLAETEKVTDVYIKTAIKLLLATGCRKREILHARWTDVDLEDQTLRLPDAKTGARPVALSTWAVDLLRELPRSTSGFLFPSPVKAGKPRNDLFKPWCRIREAAGCPDVQIKDLRHVVATMVTRDNPVQVAQAALGHRNIQTTLRYIDPTEPARAALDRLGESLRPAVERTKPTLALTFSSRKRPRPKR